MELFSDASFPEKATKKPAQAAAALLLFGAVRDHGGKILHIYVAIAVFIQAEFAQQAAEVEAAGRTAGEGTDDAVQRKRAVSGIIGFFHEAAQNGRDERPGEGSGGTVVETEFLHEVLYEIPLDAVYQRVCAIGRAVSVEKAHHFVHVAVGKGRLQAFCDGVRRFADHGIVLFVGDGRVGYHCFLRIFADQLH